MGPNLTDGDMGDIHQPRSLGLNNNLAPLLSQVRMAMLSGMDQEFLRDEEVASLEVTAAQFVIIANVLKGHANSACELCKFMDYDRGAMSRMIDRLESKGLIKRVALAHTRRTMAQVREVEKILKRMLANT